MSVSFTQPSDCCLASRSWVLCSRLSSKRRGITSRSRKGKWPQLAHSHRCFLLTPASCREKRQRSSSTGDNGEITHLPPEWPPREVKAISSVRSIYAFITEKYTPSLYLSCSFSRLLGSVLSKNNSLRSVVPKPWHKLEKHHSAWLQIHCRPQRVHKRSPKSKHTSVLAFCLHWNVPGCKLRYRPQQRNVIANDMVGFAA